MSIRDRRKAPIEKKIDKAMRKILVEEFPEEDIGDSDPDYGEEDADDFGYEESAEDSEYGEDAGELEYEEDAGGLEYGDDIEGSGYEDDFGYEEDTEASEAADDFEYEEEPDVAEYGEESDGAEYEEDSDGAEYEEESDGAEYEEDSDGAEYEEESDDAEYEEDSDSAEYEEEPDGAEYEDERAGSDVGGKQSRPDAERPRKESDGSGTAKSARPGKIRYVPITEEELDSGMIPYKRKKHKGIKVTGIVAAMVVVTAGCAYAAASYYFSDRFFYGTTINGIDCSGKTAYEVEQLIAEKVENYSIQVLARNQEPETISGSQINYTYTSDGEVLNLLKAQKPYEWIKGFFQSSSYTTQENATYDKNLLKTEVKALSCAQEENQVEPEDAYVTLNGEEFEIVSETEGAKLNIKEAYKALDSAISGNQTTIDFDADSAVYVQAAVTSTDEALQATRDAYNNYTKASITYTFGDQTVTLDSSTLKDWLEFDEKGQLVSSDSSLQEHITEYVAQLAASYDTVGTTRAFYTTSGRTVYVYGSAYGWKIDQAAEVEKLTEEIRSGSVTTRDPVYSMTANSRGTNDLGNTYIEVDLSAQHMYYYQNGVIIMESDIVSGDMRYTDRQTPEGIYTLYYKKSPDTLKGKQLADGTYEYETEVTYWMPFNGGIGFHDATWQPYFGGDRYLTGGSHGCINMPYDAAATLYSLIDYNVPIICFY